MSPPLTSDVTLDTFTLLVVTVASIVVLAMVSHAVMGPRLGAAAMAARRSLMLHALSWILMVASNTWPGTGLDRMLSTASVAGFSLTHSLMFTALGHWLGPRRGVRAIGLLAWLAPLGYFIVFEQYRLRVGWATLLLAMQLLVVAQACLFPRTSLRGHWR